MHLFSIPPPSPSSPSSVSALMWNVSHDCTAFAPSVYLWCRDRWLLLVTRSHIYCRARPRISFCPHLLISYGWAFIRPSSGPLLFLFTFRFAAPLHLQWKDRLSSDKSKVKSCGGAVQRVTEEASLHIIPNRASIFNNIAIRTCSQLSVVSRNIF